MKVFLLQDVDLVGIAHEMVTVSEGFARNFLFPRKLALIVTSENEKSFHKRAAQRNKQETIIEAKTSQLAEKIKALKLTVKRPTHDDGELYAPIRSAEIVELLASKGFSIEKNQVNFDKTIKSTGLYHISIKLSSKLQPLLQLKVIAE
jgi:large subunit ribosomal protein L9